MTKAGEEGRIPPASKKGATMCCKCGCKDKKKNKDDKKK